MTDAIPRRSPRRFAVYRAGALVLAVEDRPGTLHSRAAPGPGGPPRHPFLHATAYDAPREDELGRLLGHAADFDHYLRLLVEAGYDIVSDEGDARPRLEDGRRLFDQQTPIAALWPRPGQFTCLAWQPAPGALVFAHATLTCYREALASDLLDRLSATRAFADLCAALTTAGWTLDELTP